MKALIFDALNVFFRNFVVVPAMDDDGEAVGGVVGFLRTYSQLITQLSPDIVYVAWDGEGGSARRRRVFEGYKDGRRVRLNRRHDFESPGAAALNMGKQLSLLKSALPHAGAVSVEVAGCEGDDVVAYLVTDILDGPCVIVSSDRDFLQLVSRDVSVWSPSKKELITSDEVLLRDGVIPENHLLLKALTGDGSDEIPGVGGVGPKTALKLFPFLAERRVTLGELLDFSVDKVPTNPKYRAVVEARDVLERNVKLMDLSSPIFSASAGSLIRLQASEKPTFSSLLLRQLLVPRGVAVDNGLTSAVAEYRLRYLRAQR